MKCRFWIRKNIANNLGKAPIYCYITLNGERSTDFSTHIIVDLKKWDAKRQIIINDEYSQSQLLKVKDDLFKIESYLMDRNESFLAKNIKNIFIKYQGVPNEKISLIQYFETFLEYQQRLCEAGIKAKRTIKGMRTRFNKLKKFIKYEQREEILLKDINVKFANRFIEWIKINQQLSNNYAMKNIRILKQVLNYALEDEKLKYNALQTFKFKFDKPKQILFLELEELKIMETYRFAQDRLQRVTDLFVFECYTGLAFIDAMNFNYNLNVHKGPDKRHWIHLNRQKSDGITMLPLLRKAQKILKKYNFELPKISNQKYNSYLKEIADIIGINKKLTTHVARKTFGMLLLNEFDIPLETVSVMLGHSSIATTQRHYARVLQKKIARDMKDII